VTANPFLGVFYHWLGGLAAASFYIPYRGVKRWSWETYWLVGGFFSWILAPLLLAWLLVPDLWGPLAQTQPRTLLLAYFFGAMWGIGGLTFGLSMRYLGIALGYAIALGMCALFGTLVPPIVKGDLASLFSATGGQVILLGIAFCMVGIAVSGMAGISKERELTETQKRDAIGEFSFSRGLLVALFAGVMSACMAFALAAGQPIAEHAKAGLLATGRLDLWQNLPVLVVVLWGGFTTNLLWCLFLNVKHRSGQEYLHVPNDSVSPKAERSPLLRNYLFSAVAGVTWYLQFFFYSMGTTRLGRYGFSSWTIHMASIIIFSTLWGVALHEWKGTSKRTLWLIGLGLAVLIASTMTIGWGNHLMAVSAS
jgi:L-rhamnose-proton symport protein (RhaT).